MNGAARRTLYWAPRVPCIAFAAFIAIFAMDVFQEGVLFPLNWRHRAQLRPGS